MTPDELISQYPLRSMVFVAGPRQAGKTTFTQILTEDFNNSLYFNWDILDEKRKLIESPSFMKKSKSKKQRQARS